MKYDSGMTRYHNDIIATLHLMCGDNSEITEKFSPKDSSPAPLRDYLKGKYRNMGKHSNGVGYWCTPSKGVEVYFNGPLNNDGDKTLTLTWSQTAKFIRDNWNEIFKKSTPKPGQLKMLVNAFDEDEITCPNWVQGKTLTYLEKVNGIHFECKAFSMEFCKFDDITRFLAQHCNCPENCLYNKDTAEKQPSYIDKLREKYPKVSETDEWFDTVFCPSELFDGDGVNDPADDKCSYTAKDDEACQKCWRERCPANVALLTDPNFEDEYFENYSDEETADPIPESETAEDTAETENQIIPKNAGEISETFNYAVLSSELGDFLKRKEQQLKNEYMSFTANCGAIFAEAQEKLAGDNQYNGLFEKWINSIGFKKDTVYRMINVHKFCSSQIATSSQAELFDNLSKSLQYEVVKPSAPAELVEQVLNGDITTHKDYIALKKQLEEARSETETAKRDSEKNSAKLAAEAAKSDELERRNEELKEKNTRLALEVVKLEKRPVDVIVDSSEVNKRVAEAVSKINSETEQTLAAREQEFAETLHFKDERIWALEDKLKELGGSPGTDKKIYLLSMTDEDYRKMLAELNGSSFRNILEAAAIVDIK
ncbi:MAG: hypothetical protein K1W17_03085 [Oscillospiraceae bacterium]